MSLSNLDRNTVTNTLLLTAFVATFTAIAVNPDGAIVDAQGFDDVNDARLRAHHNAKLAALFNHQLFIVERISQ